MEKKKRKNYKLIIGIGITVALIGAVIVGIQAFGGQKIIDDVFYSDDPYNSTVPYDLFEPSSLNKSISQLTVEPVYNPLTSDYRPRWEGCTDAQYVQIFGELPKFPQDFYKKYSMFMHGELTDYDRLGPEYWQQPEFFDMNQHNFNTYVGNRSTKMWTPGTISCKPTFRLVEMKQGATVKLSTFFHTEVIGSEAYLAGIFQVVYPSSAMNYEGVKVFDQPDGVEDYIHARIIVPDNDPVYMSASFQNNMEGLYDDLTENERMFVFPATYRKVDNQGTGVFYGFSPEWSKKVTIEISVDKNCPKGNYDIGVDLRNPTTAVIQEYCWVFSGSPYYSFIFPAIRNWRPICPFFQVIVTVL